MPETISEVYSSLCRLALGDSHNNGGERKTPIKAIIPHMMAGDMSAENCARWQAEPGIMVSANYYIGSDGDIIGGVPENMEPWTSSSRIADKVAVTIEIANNGDAEDGWPISQKAMHSLVNLMADICVRNDIAPVWIGDSKDNMERQTIWFHKWFTATDCPGPYLISQMPAIVRRVCKRMAELDRAASPSDDISFDEMFKAYIKKSGP